MKKTKDMSLSELRSEAKALEERLMVISFLIYIKEGTTYQKLDEHMNKKGLT